MIEDQQIAAYIRISDADQNADTQREAIRRWLSNHGHDVDAVKWYEDHYTGRTIKRPDFDKLQSDIFNGDIKMVVIWKFNRIARNMNEGMNTLHDWCENNVRVVCITQQLDLSGTIGRVVAGVLFGIGEIELESNKEDQRRGIEAAKKRGVYTGRKKGTTKGKPERAKELKAQGLKTQEIAAVMGISKRSVYNYLDD